MLDELGFKHNRQARDNLKVPNDHTHSIPKGHQVALTLPTGCAAASES